MPCHDTTSAFAPADEPSSASRSQPNVGMRSKRWLSSAGRRSRAARKVLSAYASTLSRHRADPSMEQRPDAFGVGSARSQRRHEGLAGATAQQREGGAGRPALRAVRGGRTRSLEARHRPVER